MPTLVTPELTIFRFECKSELERWGKARSIHWKMRGNLAQLLGFDKVGDDRTTRHKAKQYFVLAEVSWFYSRNSGFAIPLFGSKEAKYRNLKEKANKHHLLSGHV